MPTNNQNLVEDNYIIEITSGVNALKIKFPFVNDNT
jgi:hypothetical protein